MRRWKVGWKHQVSGLSLRVVQGKKAPDDLRIEWLSNGRWVPVEMAAVAILTDFFVENEDVLYPPVLGLAGGRYFLAYLVQAAEQGWESADARLKGERASKEARKLPPSEPVALPIAGTCPEYDPDGSPCLRDAGHLEAHRSEEYIWPKVAA